MYDQFSLISWSY